MDETPILKLPFPEDSDDADGPTQIKALAEALDGIGPNNSVYRLLLSANQRAGNDVPAATYMLGGATGSSPLASGSSPSVALPLFYFKGVDRAVEGKTQKLRTRAQILVNATKLTIKVTVGLYPISVAGGGDSLAITLGTVVPGSTVEFNEPSASTVSQSSSSDYAIPADGVYAFGFVTSAEFTNLCSAQVSAQLQARSV